MIIKQRDATQSRISFLETYNSPDVDYIQRQGLKQAAARLRADCTSGDACRQIDYFFGECQDWFVIHDLRLRHGNRIMQINHLLVNTSLEFYIVDSRYLKYGLELNANGRCWSLNSKQIKPIASPLNKLHRDARVLRDLIAECKLLPRFLGISPAFKVQGYVLTHPTIKSIRPPMCELDTSSVIPSDMLFATVWEKRQGWMHTKVNSVDATTLNDIAQAILSRHIPAVSTKLTDAKIAQLHCPKEEEQDTSHCAECGHPVTAYVREQSFRRMDLYKGQVLCVNCQSSVVTTRPQTASF